VRGITSGFALALHQILGSYKCPAYNKVAEGGANKGKPVVRSVSMNSCLCGRTYGDPGGSWTFSGYPANHPPISSTRFNVKESDIRRPLETFVVLDEDPESINDAFFLVDQEQGMGLVDLPGRQHAMGYGINFADAMLRSSGSRTRPGTAPGRPAATTATMKILAKYMTMPLSRWPRGLSDLSCPPCL